MTDLRCPYCAGSGRMPEELIVRLNDAAERADDTIEHLTTENEQLKDEIVAKEHKYLTTIDRLTAALNLIRNETQRTDAHENTMLLRIIRYADAALGGGTLRGDNR